MPSKWGTQPARDVLAERGLPIAEVALQLGCRYSQLYNCLQGYSLPTPRVRERLPQLLGVPLESLFDAEVLEKPFSVERSRRLSRARAASAEDGAA